MRGRRDGVVRDGEARRARGGLGVRVAAAARFGREALEGVEAPVLTPAPEPGDTADIQVTPGEYTAWVQSESGIRGPSRLLTIHDRSTPTELEAPMIFEVVVPLVDAATREPLLGAARGLG